MEHEFRRFRMTKLDVGSTPSLPASGPGSTKAWGCKRINPRPQSCLCPTTSGCPSKRRRRQAFALAGHGLQDSHIAYDFPLSFKNLGELKIFGAAIGKIWVKSGSLGQRHEIVWEKQIFVYQK